MERPGFSAFPFDFTVRLRAQYPHIRFPDIDDGITADEDIDGNRFQTQTRKSTSDSGNKKIFMKERRERRSTEELALLNSEGYS